MVNVKTTQQPKYFFGFQIIFGSCSDHNWCWQHASRWSDYITSDDQQPFPTKMILQLNVGEEQQSREYKELIIALMIRSSDQ